jgi:hypothetical protein
MYWLPVTPACAILSHLSVDHSPEFIDTNLVNLGWMNVTLTWATLFLNVPFWIVMYQYLDAIIPSDYGISKHPCFCFMKTKKQKTKQNF